MRRSKLFSCGRMMTVLQLAGVMCILCLVLFNLQSRCAGYRPTQSRRDNVTHGKQLVKVPKRDFKANKAAEADAAGTKPRVWLMQKHAFNHEQLDEVSDVFKRVGYDIFDPRVDKGDAWNLLWSRQSPFQESRVDWAQLKPHQRINHFPHSGSMVSKVRLATEHYIKEIPRAFKIPYEKEEFLAYNAANSGKLWVQKKETHKGVKIKEVSEMDLNTPGTFVQEYVDKPFLVDGRRFDVGIYALLTSVHPLRVYIFNEWNMRYCPEEYYPFDPNNTHKYVVATKDFIAPSDMPSLKKYFLGEAVSRKESLFSVISEKGFDTQKLETRVMDTIRKVYLITEPKIISGAKAYPSLRQFFEMVRFDFVFDENLNVYLMEVNMSPNLKPGDHPQNKLMFQQLVYSLVNLVGVASPVVHNQSDLQTRDIDGQNMQVAGKDVYTYTDHCVSAYCADCSAALCQYCNACLTGDNLASLKESFREHMSRQNFLRVFPRVFRSQADAASWDYESDESFKSLNPSNQWITLWYRGKCMQEARFCS